MRKNEIYYSENEVMNFQSTKDKHNEEFIYKNIFVCPLNKNDCVNSMDIFDDLLVYGTIMGNVYLCRVDKNNLKPKINNKENNEIVLKVNNNIDKNKEKNDDYSPRIIKKDENNNNKEIPKIPFIKIKQLDKNNYNNNENNILSFNSNSNNNNINTHGNENNIKENNKNEEKKEINIDSKINSSIEDICDYPQITNLISNACENISCIAFDT